MNFTELKEKYTNQKAGSIEDLYKHYASRKADSLLDAMMAAIGVSALFNENSIDFDAVTPQMREAFNLSFPNKSLEYLEGLNSEQLQGVISNWKGKLFEVQVRDQLNNGEIVGDLVLDKGQYAELAESINQPGWDLQIFNADGSVDELMQLKATESMSYINEALEKYPDIDILATSEVAELTGSLQNSGISNESLNEPLTSLIDANEDVLDMILPGLPFLIIVASEGRKVFVKQIDFDAALLKMSTRAIDTGIAMGAGLLAFDVTGIGWFAFGFTFVIRRGLGYFRRGREIKKLITLVTHKEEEFLLLKASYS